MEALGSEMSLWGLGTAFISHCVIKRAALILDSVWVKNFEAKHLSSLCEILELFLFPHKGSHDPRNPPVLSYPLVPQYMHLMAVVLGLGMNLVLFVSLLFSHKGLHKSFH